MIHPITGLLFIIFLFNAMESILNELNSTFFNFCSNYTMLGILAHMFLAFAPVFVWIFWFHNFMVYHNTIDDIEYLKEKLDLDSPIDLLKEMDNIKFRFKIWSFILVPSLAVTVFYLQHIFYYIKLY